MFTSILLQEKQAHLKKQTNKHSTNNHQGKSLQLHEIT